MATNTMIAEFESGYERRKIAVPVNTDLLVQVERFELMRKAMLEAGPAESGPWSWLETQITATLESDRGDVTAVYCCITNRCWLKVGRWETKHTVPGDLWMDIYNALYEYWPA